MSAVQQDSERTEKQTKEDYHGIRVYPIRYGIHCLKSDPNKSTNYKYGYTSSGPEVQRKLSGHPQIGQYEYLLMPLRKGWLYVYSEIADGVYEFSYGHSLATSFRKTDYCGKTDKEPAWVIDVGRGFLSVSANDKIALFYSEVKLPSKYIRDVFVNEGKRNIMHKLDCKQWSSGSVTPTSQSREVAVEQVSLCYPKEGHVDYNESLIKQHKDIMTQAKVNNEKRKLKDVFFIVDDPMGVAGQLQFYLRDKHLDHEAFIRSIRTGDSFTKIRDNIFDYDMEKKKNLIPDSELLPGNAKLEHHASIHSLGILLYQLLYVNYDKNSKGRKYIDKARRSTKQEALENVLAVKQRAKLRTQIDEYRKDLQTYMQGAAYQNYCRFFNGLNPPASTSKASLKTAYYKMMLEVKNLVADTYATLSVLPHTKDQYIDGEPKSYTDPCRSSFSSAFNEKNESGKLLYKEMDLIDLSSDYIASDNKSNNAEMFFTFANSLLVSFWRDIFVDTQKTMINIKIFESNSEHGFFEVDQEALKKILATKQREIVGESQLIQKAAAGRYRFMKDLDFDAQKNTFIVETRSVINDKVKNAAYFQNKSAGYIKYITQHNAYFGIMSLFYMHSLFSLAEKDTASALFSSAQLVTGGVALRAMFLEKLAEREMGITIQAKEAKLGIHKKVFKRFVFVGNAIEVVDYFWKAIGEYSKNDHDAAIFYALAGVASAMGIVYVIGQGAYGGWVGIALAVLVVGFVLLAEHYSDTEMEKFIKRTIFGDQCNFFFKNTNIDVLHKDIKLIGTTSAAALVKEKPYLADYKFQMEEFLMIQMLTPNINVGVSYWIQDVIYSSNSLYKPTLNSRTEGIKFQFRINLLYYNERIKELSIKPYYCRKKSTKEGVLLISDDDAQHGIIPYAPARTENNVFCYNFQLNKGSTPNFYRFMQEEAYILTFIRFTDDKGQTLPYSRNGKAQSLMLRHKVTVKETYWGSKVLDYTKPIVTLDKIKIAGSVDEFNND